MLLNVLTRLDRDRRLYDLRTSEKREFSLSKSISSIKVGATSFSVFFLRGQRILVLIEDSLLFVRPCVECNITLSNWDSLLVISCWTDVGEWDSGCEGVTYCVWWAKAACIEDSGTAVANLRDTQVDEGSLLLVFNGEDNTVGSAGIGAGAILHRTFLRFHLYYRPRYICRIKCQLGRFWIWTCHSSLSSSKYKVNMRSFND